MDIDSNEQKPVDNTDRDVKYVLDDTDLQEGQDLVNNDFAVPKWPSYSDPASQVQQI